MKLIKKELQLIFCNGLSKNLHTSLPNFVKRRYPIVAEEADNLPVFQYPVSLESDRRVYVWGLAEHGALGNHLDRRTTKRRPPRYFHRPGRLHFAEQHKVVDIISGYGFTAFAINTKDKFKVFGCGINTDSQIGYHAPHRDHALGLVLSPAPIDIPFIHPDTAKVCQLAAGRAHLMVLTEKEGVYTLGNNAYGQCGRRIVKDEEYSSNRIVHHIPDLDGTTIKSIECGQDHSIFLNENGAVYTCGWGADGQTGLGHYKNEWKPSKVKGDIEGENIIKISSTADCVLAVNDKGEVFGWGSCEYNQLSPTQETSQQCTAIHLKSCQNLGKIIDVSAGGTSCLIVNDAGDVFVWGYGILGKGPNLDRASNPVQIPPTLFGRNEFEPESRVVSVSSGLSHLAAINNQGNLFMWGRNREGCLGLGHIKDQFFPLKVSIGAKVKKVSCGVDHTVAFCLPFI